MLKFILTWMSLPLLVLLLAPSLAGMIRAIDQGDFIRWIGSASWRTWLPLALIAANGLWLLVLRERAKVLKLRLEARLMLFWHRARDSQVHRETILHNGVLWRLTSHRPQEESRPTLEVEPEPRCPVCESHLETKTSGLSERRVCPSCGFSRRKVRSTDRVKEELELAAETAWNELACQEADRNEDSG